MKPAIIAAIIASGIVSLYLSNCHDVPMTDDACKQNTKHLQTIVMKNKTRLNYFGNALRKAAAALCIVASVLCITVLASGQEKQTSNKQHQTLTVSKDGRYLLDAKGKKVRQYLKSAKAFVPMTVKDKNGVDFDPAGPNKSSCHPCNCRSECI